MHAVVDAGVGHLLHERLDGRPNCVPCLGPSGWWCAASGAAPRRSPPAARRPRWPR
jgi:hypothetical protein